MCGSYTEVLYSVVLLQSSQNLTMLEVISMVLIIHYSFRPISAGGEVGNCEETEVEADQSLVANL